MHIFDWAVSPRTCAPSREAVDGMFAHVLPTSQTGWNNRLEPEQLSYLQRPDSSTMEPAGMQGIGDKDKIMGRYECFIVGIATPTHGLSIDECGPRRILLRLKIKI